MLAEYKDSPVARVVMTPHTIQKDLYNDALEESDNQAKISSVGSILVVWREKERL